MGTTVTVVLHFPIFLWWYVNVKCKKLCSDIDYHEIRAYKHNLLRQKLATVEATKIKISQCINNIVVLWLFGVGVLAPWHQNETSLMRRTVLAWPSVHKNIPVTESYIKYWDTERLDTCIQRFRHGWMKFTWTGFRHFHPSTPICSSTQASVTFSGMCKSISRTRVTDVASSKEEPSDKFVSSPILQQV